MSKITRLSIKEYIGLKEFELHPGKINIIKGAKGKGKSSVTEGIRQVLRNEGVRTEVIRHGAEEATLLVETTDGLRVNRKIRGKEKGNYLNIRKEDEGVPQTEKYLRSLSSSLSFNPIDLIKKSSREQGEILLGLIHINWKEEDIKSWFGHLGFDMDSSKHILLILKDIELFYYKNREEVNRSIREQKATIDALYKDLPIDYNGEEWRDKDVKSYYEKVYEAETKNKLLYEAKEVLECFRINVEEYKRLIQDELHMVEINCKNREQIINKNIGELNNEKLSSLDIINSSKSREGLEFQRLDMEFEREHQRILQQYKVLKEFKKKEIEEEVLKERERVSEIENKVSLLNFELSTLDEKKNKDVMLIENKFLSFVEREKIKLGQAGSYVEDNEEILVSPLLDEAKYVNDMVNHLKDWDRIIEIRDGILSEKERIRGELTAKIEKARNLPKELLKTAKMPVEGLTVDVNGNVRINGKLLDGLSDGEKLEVAMKVARESAGELKVICIDRFESLDKKSQERFLKEIENDDFQYFITEVQSTEGDDIQIEKIGGIL